MPFVTRPDAEIYYEEYGSGYPVLLFAPGSLMSQMGFWRRPRKDPDSVPVWMDPTVELARHFRVIAIDQRSSPVGKSRGRLGPNDDWTTFAKDHIAILDHLGIDRCHVMGGCIGSPFCLKMCEMVPQRVTSAVLQNPIGLCDENIGFFPAESRRWIDQYRAQFPDISVADLEAFLDRLYAGDFVFAVTRDFVRSCPIPMLVMPGDDQPHPTVIGLEIARIAPDAQLLRDWKGPKYLANTIKVVTEFLLQHTPAPVH